jgi:putative effector of murein hydrolase LrgA (UPF0299 family)
MMQSRLDIGGVIRRVFEIYVDQASVLMPAAAAVFVVTGIISAVLAATGSFLGVLVALVISLVAGTLFTGMVVELVADVQDGRRDASPGQLLRAATPVIGQLILVGLVAGVGIVIGFFLIIIPGLILITIWSVAAPVVVLERPPGLGALGRSRELVRGNGWQVFGVIVVLDVVVTIVAAVVDGVATSASTGAGIVVRVIVGVLTAPITALASAVLDFDLRKIAGGQPPVAGPTDAGPTDGGSSGYDPMNAG